MRRFWIFPAPLAIALAAFASPTAARAAPSYYFFGDSLTDEGRAGRTAPVIWSEVLRNDLSITTGRNYAIGGATSGNQASATFGNSGFLGQVNSFVAGGPYANAAAGVWIGTDDIQLGAIARTPPATIAATAAQNVRTGLGAIGGAGVSSVALLGVYDMSLTNAYELAGLGTRAVRGAAATASQLYNQQLAATSVPGVQVRYFDIANFINQLQTNARAYGFTRILPLQPGATCDATCQQTSIFADLIHLSAHTQTLIGNYVASGDPIYNAAGFTYGAIEENIASASVAPAVTQRLVQSAADQFSNSLLDRIDATRGLPAIVDPRGRPSPWTIYAYGGALAGTAGSSIADAGTPDATLAGVTLGAEYRLTPAIRLGGAFNYSHADSDLESTAGIRSRVDAYQGALYASATYPRLFVDGLVAGGSAAIDQRRDGTFGSLRADPRAGLLTAAARVGYLVPVGPIRVGPVGGVLYTRAATGTYGETGPSFFAVGTGGMTTNSLYVSGGAELRLADPSFLLIDPFVTLTYNHQLDRGAILVGSYLAFLPTQGLPGSVLTPVLDFGKLAVGSTFELGPRWYGTVTAFGIKGQDSLLAGGGNLGLGYRF